MDKAITPAKNPPLASIQRLAQELSCVNGTELGGGLDALTALLDVNHAWSAGVAGPISMQQFTSLADGARSKMQEAKNKMEGLIGDLENAVAAFTHFVNLPVNQETEAGRPQNSTTSTGGAAAPRGPRRHIDHSRSDDVHQRIDQILDGVAIPANRFCMKGDSFDTLQSVDDLMELLAAIDSACDEGSEFEMPAIGRGVMVVLRAMVRDAVKYAAEVNDLQLTLRTHAEIGGLEKFIAMYNLDKESAGVANAHN
jgi:hypothetical protein